MSTQRIQQNDVRLLLACVFLPSEYVRLAHSDKPPEPDHDVSPGAMVSLVRADLFTSFYTVALAALIGTLLAFAAGKVSNDLPVDWGKVCAAAGLLLGAWATWFALADRRASIHEARADERVRNLVFKVLFTPGVLLSMLGGLWWQ